jgi:hypothetical protein
MAVYLSPVGGAGAQFFNSNGTPLSGGKLYTYAAGTTTPQVTYTSFAGATPHSNPIILDAAGRVPGSSEIWLQFAPYKFVLKDSNDVQQATWDNISGSGVAVFIPQNFTGDGTTVAFTMSAAPYSENTTFIYINGVYQQKNTYSLSGATLTFSEAPPNTSKIEVMYT